jgi:hypothetical protein
MMKFQRKVRNITIFNLKGAKVNKSPQEQEHNINNNHLKRLLVGRCRDYVTQVKAKDRRVAEIWLPIFPHHSIMGQLLSVR